MDDAIINGSIRAAMDNHGEMSRFRSQNGVRISPSPSVSTYIICVRITRVIKEYAMAKPGIPSRKIDRLISKIDKLGKTELEYLHHLGTEDSVAKMISVIGKNFTQISSEANKWKWKGEPENL